MASAAGQIALPLAPLHGVAERIVTGPANAQVVAALCNPAAWPYRTAVLTGPPRSGKSLLARWFAEGGRGQAVDDAPLLGEDALFHRWNRAQAEGAPLLIVGGSQAWRIGLPDLRSRLGAALQLSIGQPDDAMAAELLLALAEQRGLALGPEAAAYLVPRAGRSHAMLERLVAEIDRLSLERKGPATQTVWRAALEAAMGPAEPRLL
ncbi:ATPase [Croceibacterium sp. TMG7-5b_MA50]|uniref:HdaA/DnaA family protein n=1 Tax=Croceibacterium sp. TMG7-5b_MA50 TaxID=3121290 RepID=UPI003221B560